MFFWQSSKSTQEIIQALKELRIRSIRLYRAKTGLKKPISDATHNLAGISFIILRLQLENGVVGSYLLSFPYSPHAIIGAFKDVFIRYWMPGAGY